ncbi:MAG: C4-dicarboxylate transporter, DcuC family [Abditibacteriota bacterium]|nr:C4-dicarboxylate transporter, DcuC family [Abditibacteriota bacterium]
MVPALGLQVIVAAVYGGTRKVDVRLALLLASLLLGTLSGQPAAVLQKFLTTFSDEKNVVAICTAIGFTYVRFAYVRFAYVLRHSGCDAHLVELLCQPLRRVRTLVIPGAVLVGFAVDIPIISQTSTAVAIGSVLIALMSAAGISAMTSGAVLILGASISGELPNPGAPEYGAVIRELNAVTATTVTLHTRRSHDAAGAAAPHRARPCFLVAQRARRYSRPPKYFESSAGKSLVGKCTGQEVLD